MLPVRTQRAAHTGGLHEVGVGEPPWAAPSRSPRAIPVQKTLATALAKLRSLRRGFQGLHGLAKARGFLTGAGNIPSLSPGHPMLLLSAFQALAANQSHLSFQSLVPEMPDLFKMGCLDEPVYVGMLDTQH